MREPDVVRLAGSPVRARARLRSGLLTALLLIPVAMTLLFLLLAAQPWANAAGGCGGG